MVRGQPVLVDFENSILDRDYLLASTGDSPIKRRRRSFFRGVFFNGSNKVAPRIAAKFVEALPQDARVLVVGGGTVGEGADLLYETFPRVVGTDIYASEHTSVIADGHKLPFIDGSFDAVWIQAVLEHVLDPAQVVAEIWRVLRPGGLVFADTPFMQQVHEGAYDFTRFTLSGHRWLFRKFDLIEAGSSGGVGVALIWSIRYFAYTITRSGKMGRLASTLVFWLRFFEGKGRMATDAASGVYFYGSKSNYELRPKEIVSFYNSMS